MEKSRGQINCFSDELSPEIELILRAARHASDDALSKTGSSIMGGSFDKPSENPLLVQRGKEGINWGRLEEIAAHHGMRPLLYNHLKSVDSKFIPREVIESLAGLTKLNTQRNLRVTGYLWEIITALESQGISIIPYKGPTLASLVYGDLGMREFSDLDILINRKDVFKAQETFKALGYLPEVNLVHWQENIFLETGNVLLFTHQDTQTLVELHWQLSPGYLAPATDVEALRKRLVDVYPGGRKMKTLSPEDYLVYLCVHGAKHLWERLSWLTDIATLISKERALDWDFVTQEASRQKSDRMFLLGLQLAKELMGISLPKVIEERITSVARVRSLAATSKKWLLTSYGSYPRFQEKIIYRLKLHSGWRERIKYVVLGATAPNTMDWAFIDLPESLSFLYRLARPIRLLKGMLRPR